MVIKTHWHLECFITCSLQYIILQLKQTKTSVEGQKYVQIKSMLTACIPSII